MSNDDKEMPVSGPGWRWHLAVLAVFLLAIMFFGLAFILVLDPGWAYQLLAPQK